MKLKDIKEELNNFKSMKILPAINCINKECLANRLGQIDRIFEIYESDKPWIHIDVADGGFTRGYSTWRNPRDLKMFNRQPPFLIEIHMMVNNPEEIMESWLNQDISRLIFHLESTANVNTIVDFCNSKGVDPMLALSPGTSASHAMPYLKDLKSCQVLAVNPGQAAQDFQEEIFDKIKQIKDSFPKIMLEVDGGINPETGKKCIAAGANQLVSASYIWKNLDPAKAYKELCDLDQ